MKPLVSYLESQIQELWLVDMKLNIYNKEDTKRIIGVVNLAYVG